jgi:hypothetical protein
LEDILKYIYFVSFTVSSGQFGCVECTTTKKIETVEHLISIAKDLEKEHSLKEVIILNYKLLRTEDE